jgi:amino acid transporter
MALNELIGTRGSWRLRTILIYGSIIFLVIFAARSLLLPPAAAAEAMPLAAGNLDTLPRTLALMAAALWGLNFVLDSRDELRNPSRNILPALLVPVALCGIIGAFVAVSELRLLGVSPNDPTPLATLAISTSFRGEALFEVVYVSLGLFISLITIDRAIVTMLRLTGTMVRDGFLPQQFLKITPTLGTPLLA